MLGHWEPASISITLGPACERIACLRIAASWNFVRFGEVSKTNSYILEDYIMSLFNLKYSKKVTKLSSWIFFSILTVFGASAHEKLFIITNSRGGSLWIAISLKTWSLISKSFWKRSHGDLCFILTNLCSLTPAMAAHIVSSSLRPVFGSILLPGMTALCIFLFWLFAKSVSIAVALMYSGFLAACPLDAKWFLVWVLGSQLSDLDAE